MIFSAANPAPGKRNAHVLEGVKFAQADFFAFEHADIGGDAGVNFAGTLTARTVALPPTVWIMATSLFGSRRLYFSKR